ncbi:2-(1,2-epoxy-1,2-dihydrophenyl)acetyl-CoA isomerase [Sphingomonas laterariae]|uniref:2-(1,2-epoxy-1,2-dihydrophenyl)acetyl-CoA isomerase n=1 Tax=Edaphosphingomonas laterariae TaxID=861865 RepID=A0A239D6J4_9SPHN|nr:enoyl-CoA hydratase-related protein [Sphingomonas laterariae]SNS27481.1 2-(1,2-epoxy-1,2-dihydrophenyl)acetyl-CoA isomerase [Sphingomonas laterariae]
MSDRVTLEIAGGIARLSLANPARRNAIDLEFLEDFAAAALDIQSDASVRVILLRADGPVFSVGGDLADMVANRHRAERHVLEMASLFHLGIERLQASRAPLVVALGGTAAGGGFSLVLGADLVIAGQSAKLVSAYLKSGLTPDGGATWFLPRLVGRQKAFEIMALSPVLSAQDAQALGLVARVVADDALDAEATAVAAQLAALPSDALFVLKRQLHASPGHGLADQLAVEAGGIARSAAQPDVQAALDAFFAKGK